MVNIKTSFVCRECGYKSARWLGRCPTCDSWNTFCEEVKDTNCSNPKLWGGQVSLPKPISEVVYKGEVRHKTGISELDKLLGGGIVEGAFILLAGAPGIGKSTMLLEIAENISSSGKKCFYVSGEESCEQIKIRADRINAKSNNIILLAESNMENIFGYIEEQKPSFVFIDSIQTVYFPSLETSPGSVVQIRECADKLMFLAKQKNIPVIISGHITKEGAIAGPKILEHMVDVVLSFEGSEDNLYRMLRVEKNRFGMTSEVAVFAMEETGLKEILNPSEIFLEERSFRSEGSCIVSNLEGTRPFFIEIQALISKTAFPMPRRQISGLDYNRVLLLIAVLEKRLGINFVYEDIFVNVAGGMKIKEPASDLGVIVSIYSIYKTISIDSSSVFMGEVGLGGEVRSITFFEKRVKEAEKMGFKTVFVPKGNIKKNKFETQNIEVVGVSDILDCFQKCFSKK